MRSNMIVKLFLAKFALPYFMLVGLRSLGMILLRVAASFWFDKRFLNLVLLFLQFLVYRLGFGMVLVVMGWRSWLEGEPSPATGDYGSREDPWDTA